VLKLSVNFELYHGATIINHTHIGCKLLCPGRKVNCHKYYRTEAMTNFALFPLPDFCR